MIKKLLTVSISLAFAVIPHLTQAEGNITAGETQTSSCIACHGDSGNSVVPNFPKLAGQHASYLTSQLMAFKTGTRDSAMMGAVARALDPQAIADISAYYASKKVSSNPLPFIESDDDDDEDEDENQDSTAEVNALIAIGAELYRNGNLETEVSACIACHGPDGEGNKPSSFPVLQGQHADYLIAALAAFKEGERSQDSNNIMHMIAKKMSKQEIQAVSFYISMMK